MEVRVDWIDSDAVVTPLAEDFLGGNSEMFRVQMKPVIGSARNIVVDFEQVRFLDSAGCGMLLSIRKALVAAGGRIH
ncbi:MAG TPA: STAS domain-containing protein, partial [Planctomycetia bacterium]|nr:STAS domain-containing protein [Planctomycetia bacterium]